MQNPTNPASPDWFNSYLNEYDECRQMQAQKHELSMAVARLIGSEGWPEQFAKYLTELKEVFEKQNQVKEVANG